MKKGFRWTKWYMWVAYYLSIGLIFVIIGSIFSIFISGKISIPFLDILGIFFGWPYYLFLTLFYKL